MSDKKKREAVERAIKLTRRAKKLGEVTAKTRQLAGALENHENVMAELEKLLEEYKTKKVQDNRVNRPTKAIKLPDAKACMDASNKARKESKKQRLLAKKAAERVNDSEGLVKAAWKLAASESEEAEDAAETWIEAADAWEEAATQLS